MNLFPDPGQPSEPPSWSDIERLALHYPTCQVAVMMVKNGTMTKEVALIYALFAFAVGFRTLFNQEIERQQNVPAGPLLQCVDCKNTESPAGAMARQWNHGRCMHCGGFFKVVRA